MCSVLCSNSVHLIPLGLNINSLIILSFITFVFLRHKWTQQLNCFIIQLKVSFQEFPGQVHFLNFWKYLLQACFGIYTGQPHVIIHFPSQPRITFNQHFIEQTPCWMLPRQLTLPRIQCTNYYYPHFQVRPAIKIISFKWGWWDLTNGCFLLSNPGDEGNWLKAKRESFSSGPISLLGGDQPSLSLASGCGTLVPLTTQLLKDVWESPWGQGDWQRVTWAWWGGGSTLPGVMTQNNDVWILRDSALQAGNENLRRQELI